MYVTVVTPTGKTDPEIWFAVRVAAPQLSVAIGVFQMATAPLIMVLVGTNIFDGQFDITGAILSVAHKSTEVTVTIKLQVPTLLFTSFAE